jgi:hypothetical protein
VARGPSGHAMRDPCHLPPPPAPVANSITSTPPYIRKSKMPIAVTKLKIKKKIGGKGLKNLKMPMAHAKIKIKKLNFAKFSQKNFHLKLLKEL